MRTLKFVALVLLVAIVASCGQKESSNEIIIKGKVKFPDNRFKMMIVKRDGFDKIVVDSFKLDANNTYMHKMKVVEPGEYTLECQKWQSVQFWAEDENLEIDFRGQDTAKMKIKNPPFVYIKGGKSNEVMNLLNFDNHRNYQLMIAMSQSAYKNLKDVGAAYGAMIGDVYGSLGKESDARTEYIVKNYSERNSVISAIKRLRGAKYEKLVKESLAKLEAKNPNYAPLVKYKRDKAEAKAKKEKLELGKVAPDFKFKTPEGKEVSPRDFKGKFLIIDFWASWCGPCRNEIPNVEKVYKKFKDSGVEVLSVSIDKKKKEWLKALKEEGMTWTQVQTPDAGKQIMKDYQFSGIPYIILLDKNNKIIGKNLRGKKLFEAVEKALK